MKHISYIIAAALSIFALSSCQKDPSTEPEKKDNGIPKLQTLTVADFVAQPKGETYFHLKGTVESISDEHYSQFVLKDETGSVSVFGLWDSEGGARLYDMAGHNVGDEIQIAAQKSEYKGTAEARNAYPYNPEEVKLWVETASVEIGAEGGETFVSMIADGTPEIKSDSDWLTAAYDPEGQKLAITVAASESLDARAGDLTVTCGKSVQTIRVTQAAYVPVIESIASAINKSFAKVSGQITAMGTNGYVLTDDTGSIFVKADNQLGLDFGMTMEVAGNISTENFLTSMETLTVRKNGKGTANYDKATKFDGAAAEALASSLASKSATKAGELNLPCVQAVGVLSNEDGQYLVRDYDTDKLIAVVDVPLALDVTGFVGEYVVVYGFVAEFKDGKFTVIPGKVGTGTMISDVKIDAEFADWTGIQGFSQNVEGNPLKELKYYICGTDVFIYVKADASTFTEFGSLKYFFQIYFNIDNNNETGPYFGNFYGLDSSHYLYICDGQSGFTNNANGSTMTDFVGGDGTIFYSANSSLFAGTFTPGGGMSFSCGGKIEGEIMQFEWTFKMSQLKLPRHSSFQYGIRLAHEHTSPSDQENYFMPADGWTSFEIK